MIQEGTVVGLANHTALISRDGTERPIADSGAPIRSDGGPVEGVVMVFRDATAMREAEVERERARRAETAVRERDVFLSVAAHELRTPLTALRLKLEGLEKLVASRLPPETAAKATARFNDALRQTTRLAELVERLLEVSRIAGGRLVLEIGDVDLRALAEHVVAGAAELAGAARSAIELSATGDCTGRWDRGRIEQVLVNLIRTRSSTGRANRWR